MRAGGRLQTGSGDGLLPVLQISLLFWALLPVKLLPRSGLQQLNALRHSG
jgi:hypothetical protein